MKRISKVSIYIFLITFISGGTLQAENVDTIMDRFYDGLAKVIESNMDDPDRCVSEVDDYYEKNRATVEKIRKTTEKGMATLGDIYKSTSEEALKDYEVEALSKESSEEVWTGVKMPKGATRYTKAIETFTVKYPHHALRIATKALELLPQTKDE